VDGLRQPSAIAARGGHKNWRNTLTKDYSHETRAIYHAQHSRIAADERAMSRFINMFSEEYFGLPKGWFADKSIVDAGCGSTGKVLIALHRMGATRLHGFDLDTDFIPTAQASTRAHGVPDGVVTLKSGSVLDAPYPDASFDFVCCHGVLLHLNSIEESRKGFAELVRITKPGGYLYTVFGISGGALEQAIYPALREHYRRTPAFKSFIDGIKPADLQAIVDLVMTGLAEHEGEHIDLSAFKALLDTDLCVTMQNILQAPVRLSIPEPMILEMYGDQFDQPRRLRRYVKRTNIRRFLAPLHYATPDNTTLQLWYGSGNLEFIARKKM
jgi:SAM-dependent methyltransferase